MSEEEYQKAKAAQKEADAANALWRVPEWMPTLDPGVQTKLKLYHTELLKFNPRLNLISRTTEREADETHFIDCLLAFEVMRKVTITTPIFDIGSGNGFPGLIFAVMDSAHPYILLESDMRKCEFMKHVAAVLELKNISIMNSRLENLKQGEIQTAISRGFASISKTALACNRIFESGSRFFHMKGSTWSTEIAEIPSQLIAQWKPELIGEYSLPNTQARRGVVCTTKI
jgi:16S rRNA (guanine527-N7)-methyltransferase